MGKPTTGSRTPKPRISVHVSPWIAHEVDAIVAITGETKTQVVERLLTLGIERKELIRILKELK